MGFLDRVIMLPRLGVGVSTEYGAFSLGGGLDLDVLCDRYPEYAQFLEVGVEAKRGVDDVTKRWREREGATTYHFLDINLDEPEDRDVAWLDAVRQHIELLDPAWLCGDAGLWHFGPRDRGHMLLLPPILSRESAFDMGDGIAGLRDEVGREVLPENPPGHVFLGDLHLLDYYAQVCERGDTGMLLDCAHLAIYQRLCGHQPLTALNNFPLERIVEIHVAGGTEHAHDGFAFVEDDHSPNVLPETWRIFDHLVARCPNLKAVVFECERNPLELCLAGFERITRMWS